MVAMADLNLPDSALRAQIASAIDVVVQASRMSDGTRRITQIAEVVGMEGEVITMQDIFVFEQTGVDEDGKVLGRLRPTGIRPRSLERLAPHGFEMGSEAFTDTASAMPELRSL
jgi:pilus assembly protein CpaF